MSRLSRAQVNGLGRLGLHAKRQLVALDPGVELGLVNPRKKMTPVELAEVIELALLPCGPNAQRAFADWRSAAFRRRAASPDRLPA